MDLFIAVQMVIDDIDAGTHGRRKPRHHELLEAVRMTDPIDLIPRVHRDLRTAYVTVIDADYGDIVRAMYVA